MKRLNITRFSTVTLLTAMMCIGLLLTSTGNAQSGAEVIYNTKTEKLEADRILLRYTQLWNLYRFRNDPVMTEDQKIQVEALMSDSRGQNLHSDMPIADIKERIKKNAVELRKLLRLEVKTSEDPYAAQANLDYLDKTLLRGFANEQQYAKLPKKRFSEEFNRMLPAAEYQPTSGRHIISQ